MSAPNNDELCFRCGHERRHHGFKCGDPSHDHGPLSCNERATTPDGRATVPICPCHEFLPEPRPKVAAMRICEYCGQGLGVRPVDYSAGEPTMSSEADNG